MFYCILNAVWSNYNVLMHSLCLRGNAVCPNKKEYGLMYIFYLMWGAVFVIYKHLKHLKEWLCASTDILFVKYPANNK